MHGCCGRQPSSQRGENRTTLLGVHIGPHRSIPDIRGSRTRRRQGNQLLLDFVTASEIVQGGNDVGRDGSKELLEPTAVSG